MEGSGSGSKREGKRRLDESDDDYYDRGSAPKQQKTPVFGRVVLEALKMDGLQKMFSYFEPFFRKILREEMQQCLLGNDDPGKLGPLIRKIVCEELQNALRTSIPDNSAGRSSPPRIKASGGRELCLHVVTKMPDHLFAGKKVDGEGGSAIYVILTDLTDGSVVTTGQESTAKLNVLALEGDFDQDFNDGWTNEIFKSHQVKVRNGKGPILIGDLQVTLKDGVGTLGDLQFTDNSSWTRTKKFRLGVEVAPGFCEGTRVKEAKTEAFAVLDQRGECNRKHSPPDLQDELYRLKGIAKGKPLHEILLKAGIITVEDLLRLHAKDPRNLRNMLKDKTTDNKWKRTIEHAKTCNVSGGGKCYVFYTDETQSIGIVFNHIHELEGIITNGKVLSLGSVSQTKEIAYFVKIAYENWHQVIEYDDHVLGSAMQTTGETSGAGWPNSLKDCLQPNNGQGLEQNFGEPFQIMDDEMTDMRPFINPQVGFVSTFVTGETSKAGCSYSSEEDWLPQNNSPRMERYVDDETMENSEINFGIQVGNDIELTAIFSPSNEALYSCGMEPEPNHDELLEVDPLEEENGMNRRKAVVGWLKIKVALRWGEMMRKKAAERRAQLTETD